LKDAQGLPKEEQLLIRNNELGHAYFQKGEHKKAILRLEKDVELFEQVGDMRQWARCIYVLAEAYRTESRIEDAVMALTRLIEYAKERDDLELLFRAYNGIGNIYNDQNDFENAAKFYERAVDVSSRMGGEDQMIACVANLGIVYSNAGDMKKAEEQLTSALGFLEGRKTLSGILEQYHCRVHLELGEIFRIGKKFDLAMAQLSEAEACAQTPAAAELLFWVKLTKAKTAVDMGDQTASKAYLLEAEKLADTDEKKKRLQSQK
jgi:tetratricopeptide (TPR) repeat protein